MIIERKKYLDELIAGRGNGLVKIITGVRRCGKSFLLFDIWHNWLLEHGVTNSHIIEIQLDDFRNRRLRKPDALLDYIDSKVVDDVNPYYIVLDEVQLVEEFVEHQTPPKKRSGLHVPTQVLSLAVESTCDGHRKYVHFLNHFFSFFKATMTNTTIININNLKLQ